MLLLSIALGIVPLLGIAWIMNQGTVTTVDGLFTSLILLALSGVLFVNVYVNLRGRSTAKTPPAQKAS